MRRGERHGRRYGPVLRPEPTGSRDLTWGEIVEARYLRAYRQEKNVPMQQLRPFIARLREEFGVPSPLAHFKPFIGEGRRLLLQVQESVNLPDTLSVVYEVKTGQLILDPRVTEFLDRVEFAEHGGREAERIYPAGRQSPDVDTPIEAIADDFGLPAEVVRAAVAYEWSYAS